MSKKQMTAFVIRLAFYQEGDDARTSLPGGVSVTCITDSVNTLIKRIDRAICGEHIEFGRTPDCKVTIYDGYGEIEVLVPSTTWFGDAMSVLDEVVLKAMFDGTDRRRAARKAERDTAGEGCEDIPVHFYGESVFAFTLRATSIPGFFTKLDELNVGCEIERQEFEVRIFLFSKPIKIQCKPFDKISDQFTEDDLAQIHDFFD